ncbi:MAG: leucyl/phenylalanyl-tRNA--protein transferase [Flavobacteriales bacterium]
MVGEEPLLIPVDVLVAAYTKGWFPMCHEDGELYWHDPDPRAVFPLDTVAPNARMRTLLRCGRFSTTVDRVFDEVIHACADRDETWIDGRIARSYAAIHQAGQAHSVETWQEGQLVGGIYGVAIGGAFFGESMFSRVSNASKVAFYELVAHLKRQGFVLFDSQYVNPFTRQLGAVEVPRAEFQRTLEQALALPIRF